MGLRLLTRSNLILLACLSMLLITTIQIFFFLQNKSVDGYSLNEYLINYQGGFVRRGLIGEIAFNSNDPANFVTITQKMLIVFSMLGFIILIFFEKSNLSRLIYTATLIFIPGGLNDFTTGYVNEYLGRKEFWFYSALIIFGFTARHLSQYPIAEGAIIGITSSFVMLIHELFFIFIVILFTTFLLVKKNYLNRNHLIGALFFYIPVLTTFYFVVKNHGDERISNAILQSYQKKFPNLDVGTGNIQNITWSIQRSHEGVLAVINEGSILYYIFFAITALVFLLIYGLFKFRKKSHLRIAGLVLMANLMSALMIFYFFWDVGRLISIFSIVTVLSFHLLSTKIEQLEKIELFRFNSSENTSSEFLSKATAVITVSYLIAIGLITRVESCCSQPANIPLFGIFGLT